MDIFHKFDFMNMPLHESNITSKSNSTYDMIDTQYGSLVL